MSKSLPEGMWVELSDDDLDGLSAGIPYSDNFFGGYQELDPSRPALPVLQDRPSDDPELWF